MGDIFDSWQRLQWNASLALALGLRNCWAGLMQPDGQTSTHSGESLPRRRIPCRWLCIDLVEDLAGADRLGQADRFCSRHRQYMSGSIFITMDALL